jgi:hypothetical protein
MAIDPRIALGVQPAQIQSPLETTANVLQLQAMQQRNALAQRQFEAEQATAAREADRQMRLGAFLDVNRGNNLLDPAKAARMLALGGGEELGRYTAAQTANLTQQKQAADLAASERERGVNQRRAAYGIVTAAMNSPESYDMLWNVARDMYGDEFMANIPRENPGKDRLAAIAEALLTPAERAEYAAKRETAAIQRRQLTQSDARLGEEQRQFDLTRQDKAAQPAEGAKPPVGYEYAPDGSLRSIKGGPADPDVIAAKKRAEAAPATEARAKTAQQGINTVNASILELRSAYESLRNKGAIPSEGMASMGLPGITANLGAYAAASETGQAVGRAFGSEAQSDRDVIRAATMRLASAVARATGQTSQQLNSNVELQLALKSLGDPQSSYESNLRILDYLDRFVRENYAGDATGAAASGASGITSSGTSYTVEE